MGEPEVRPSTEAEIEADWREFTGGPPVVGVLRAYEPSDVDGILWRDPVSGRTGVVTWWVDGERAEITSVHAEPPGGGTGTRVMDAGGRGASPAWRQDRHRRDDERQFAGGQLLHQARLSSRAAARRRDGPLARAQAWCPAHRPRWRAAAGYVGAGEGTVGANPCVRPGDRRLQ